MSAASSLRDAAPRDGHATLLPPPPVPLPSTSRTAKARPASGRKRRNESSSAESAHGKSTNRKRYLRFLKSHELKFGLAPVARDVTTGEVTIVVCRFCQYYGREQRPDKQRRSTKNVKYFRNSFRTDQYQQHHEISHGERWRQYQLCSDDVKSVFFQVPEAAAAAAASAGRQTRPVHLSSAQLDVELAPGEIWALDPTNEEKKRCFDVAAAIVEVVAVLAIGASEMTVESAMRKQSHRVIAHAHEAPTGARANWCPPDNMFQSCKLVGSATEPMYRVIVHSRSQIDCMVELAAAGLSFRQISSAMQSFCSHAPVLLAGLTPTSGDAASHHVADACYQRARNVSLHYSEDQTAEFIRLILAANLTVTSRLLRRSWAFSLELRASMEHAPMRSYLDFRVKVYGHGAMHNVHLVSIPAFESKCKGMMYNTLDKVLTAVLPSWRYRLIGLTTDGDARMPARVLDIVARLQEEAAIPVVYRSSSACHQLDCIVTNYYSSLQGGCFLLVLKDLSSYIRRRPELLAVMSPPPPLPGVTTGSSRLHERWVALGRETNWIAAHRDVVFQHLETDQPPSAPDAAWWLFFAVADWVATRTNETFAKLLSKHAVIADHVAALASLSRACAAAFSASGPDTASSSSSSSSSSSTSASTSSHGTPFKSRRGRVALHKSGVLAFLRATQPALKSLLAATDAPVIDLTAENVALCSVNLIESLLELSTELSHNNNHNNNHNHNHNNHNSRTSGLSTRALTDFLPPTLPHEWVHLSDRAFASLLHVYGPLLARSLSPADMASLGPELDALRRAAATDSVLSTALAACTADTPFHVAWALLQRRYAVLERVAGGFASVYACAAWGPRTSDLALCRSDTDTARVLLADFALEGTLHAQQFPALRALQDARGLK